MRPGATLPKSACDVKLTMQYATDTRVRRNNVKYTSGLRGVIRLPHVTEVGTKE